LIVFAPVTGTFQSENCKTLHNFVLFPSIFDDILDQWFPTFSV